jgi:gluconokinase
VSSGSGAAILALDVGTSSCRASLYSAAEGRALRGRPAQVRYAVETTAEGGAEADAAVLLEHVCACIDRVLAQPRLPPIAGVATSTFWHSLLGLDGDGRPLTPVYLWLDARSRQAAAELRRRLDEQAVHSRTGCVLHWSYWPAKLTWLGQTQPDLTRRVARWVSFGEFLLERLTGQRGVSVSMASGTGLLDQHTCEWDQALLTELCLEPTQLNRLVPLTDTRVAHGRWPALHRVPWLAAIGDGACSNLGAGCATDAWFAVMIGTSAAQRGVMQPGGVFDIPRGTWCYRVDERRIVLGGAMNDGGNLLDWLRHGLRLPPLERLDAELAALEPDAHGLTVLPFWGGERSVGWSDDARGAVVGLRLHTRPIDVARAALEAVALRFAALDARLRRAMPRARGELVATGGALLHSAAWLQIMADALGRPVHVSTEPEASSRGASLLAAETLGLLGHRLEDLQPEVSRVFEPVPEHTQRYQRAAARQQRLYDLLIPSSPEESAHA